MTPENQRKAIAEACGWMVFNLNNGNHKLPNGDWECGVRVPDYPNDLNAMHEAEKLLEQVCIYESLLDLVCVDSFGGARMATASQRAEAFLRTIGKWEE